MNTLKHLGMLKFAVWSFKMICSLFSKGNITSFLQTRLLSNITNQKLEERESSTLKVYTGHRRFSQPVSYVLDFKGRLQWALLAGFQIRVFHITAGNKVASVP